MKKLNVYVVGSSKSYANWLISGGGKLVDTMEESDIVVFTGGADIGPELYGAAQHPSTYIIESRDIKEVNEFRKAISLDKPIWGTCRGLQLSCAMAGGELIQNIRHPGNHEITFYDHQLVVETNSIHHQMIYPYRRLKDVIDYHIVAYSSGLSPYYQGESPSHLLSLEKNDKGYFMEPEAAFFPKINAFGQQSHLEMQLGRVVTRVTRKLVHHQIMGELDAILTLKIPMQRVLRDDFSLTQSEQETFIHIKKDLVNA